MADDPLNIGALNAGQESDDQVVNLIEQYAMLHATPPNKMTPEQRVQYAQVSTAIIDANNRLGGDKLSALVTRALPQYGNPQALFANINDYNLNDSNSLINRTLSSGGGGGGGGSSSSTISRQVQETQRGQVTQQQTKVNYVDMPTPQEFLDNFQNGFEMHLNGLESSGAIGSDVANFARQNMGIFYSDYMRQQVKDMLSGKPLFRVVGADSQGRLIGARAGDYSSGTTAEQQQSGYNLQQQEGTSSSGGGGVTQSQALTADLALGGAPGKLPGGGIGALSASGRAVGDGSGGGSSSSLNLSENANLDSLTGQTSATTEALVQRNKLAVVSNLSPLDFLKGGANAQRLNFLYAGQKGAAERGMQTATGAGAEQQVRRVG